MQTVLISGANRGIGLHLVKHFLAAGWRVVATCRQPDSAEALKALAGASLQVLQLEVTDERSVRALVAALQGCAIDVLINNAGILSINALEDESMAMIQAVMNTNFFGPVRCMKAVVPAMRERRQGLIINLSSIAGRMAVFSHSAYGPSKFALEAASEVAAQELAPFGVRVALVEPGIIATDMAVANLPQPRADSEYPSGRRMVAMNADADKGTPPAVVANAVLDIVSGRNTAFRTLCGDDSQMFIGMRTRMSDDAWIAMSDTMDDGVFFDRMTAAMQG